MYSNTKVGDFLAESNPKTLKVQPGWAKSLGAEVHIVADKIKITDSGKIILSGTFENIHHNSTIPRIYYCVIFNSIHSNNFESNRDQGQRRAQLVAHFV